MLKKMIALETIGQVAEAYQNEEFVKVAILLGITPDVAEDMTEQDFVDSIIVRMSDLAKSAGLNLGE